MVTSSNRYLLFENFCNGAVGGEREVGGVNERQIFTVRKPSYGKVMFSQASVKNSVHSGEAYTSHREMATSADGMHPIRMHSCLEVAMTGNRQTAVPILSQLI